MAIVASVSCLSTPISQKGRLLPALLFYFATTGALPTVALPTVALPYCLQPAPLSRARTAVAAIKYFFKSANFVLVQNL